MRSYPGERWRDALALAAPGGNGPCVIGRQALLNRRDDGRATRVGGAGPGHTRRDLLHQDQRRGRPVRGGDVREHQHGVESKRYDTSERVGCVHCHHWLRGIAPRDSPAGRRGATRERGVVTGRGGNPPHDNDTQTGRKSHPTWAFFLQCAQITQRAPSK